MKKRIKEMHLSNEGFSLIEMVVTMLISSIVVAAVAGFMSMGLNYYRRTNAETVLQTESQIAELFLTELLQESQDYTVHDTGDCPAGVSYVLEVTRDGKPYIVARKGDVLVYGEADPAKTNVTERIQEVTDKGLDETFLTRYVSTFTVTPTVRTTAIDAQNGLVNLNLAFDVDGKTYVGNATVSLRNTVKN